MLVPVYGLGHPLVVAYIALLNARVGARVWTCDETTDNARVSRGADCVFMIDRFTGEVFYTKSRAVWQRGKHAGHIERVASHLA